MRATLIASATFVATLAVVPAAVNAQSRGLAPTASKIYRKAVDKAQKVRQRVDTTLHNYGIARPELRHQYRQQKSRGLRREARPIRQAFKQEGWRAMTSSESFVSETASANGDGSYNLKLYRQRFAKDQGKLQPKQVSYRGLGFDAQTGASHMSVVRYGDNGTATSAQRLHSRPDGSFTRVSFERQGSSAKSTRVIKGQVISQNSLFKVVKLTDVQRLSQNRGDSTVTSVDRRYQVRLGNVILPLPRFLGRALENRSSR